MTLNARTEEDVDPELVLQQLAKSTAGDGVKVSTTSEIERSGPVVSLLILQLFNSHRC